MIFTLRGIIWAISIIVFFAIFAKMATDWICIKDDNLKEKTKVILVIVAILSVIFMCIYLHLMLNPNSNRKDEVISITQISEVYKSNIDATGNEDDSCYYVIKEGDAELYEIIIEKTLQGDGNYIITKKYSNGDTIYELILKNKEIIKPLPSFNK